MNATARRRADVLLAAIGKPHLYATLANSIQALDLIQRRIMPYPVLMRLAAQIGITGRRLDAATLMLFRKGLIKCGTVGGPTNSYEIYWLTKKGSKRL